ncbi:Outer membrane protein Imp [Methylophaga frappieri]|uniref:LPS-assembly protein LptD n=1 Tax=Methylophaga frappieri (strain ATCC BAA-2434 / DSM 25690 / JAM7) TaxID=754477 RepID=I1YL37_METFJ|nr:LPS-assembly protein LptD [Methylophaga frappieri]AFJ03630.1 Outer membrane protein Imp [Methylophaga frappieri]
MRKLILLSAGIFASYSPLAAAFDRNILPARCDVLDADMFMPQSLIAPAESEVNVDADDAQFVEQGTSVFTGNVEVSRGNQQLNANRATYNHLYQEVTAQGDVTLRDSEIKVSADQAEWSLQEDQGAMIDADYLLRQQNARGEASHVFRQGVRRTLLKNASYTTCTEEDEFWVLEADNVDLDHDEAVGRARDVVLRMGGLPVFYTPYISFPLNDERKSGFLVPSIGNSDETGFDVSTPYYWNIAPNQDATLTPRYMSDRGMMLNAEYRYLTSNNQGLFDVGYLGSDNLRRDGEVTNPYYQEDRKHFTWQQQGRFSDRWSNYIDYNYTSDRNYLEDFSGNLSLSSTTHLRRLAQVNYHGDIWRFAARAQGYQTLFLDVEEPYQMLPQLTLRGFLPDQALGLTYELDTEFTAFDSDDRVTGQRFDFEPAISLPWGNAGAFMTPRVAVKQSYYNLDNVDRQPAYQEENISRTVPIVSLDSGLVFERPLTFANKGYIQTLEPRAFYLYIPERNQDDIPLFDTTMRTFTMGSLFSHDRFTGPDRVGDANQLSLALTSRIIDATTGRQKFALTLGQIQYFSDRDVGLQTNQRRDDRSDSDYIAEVIAEITKNWTASGQIQWNPDADETTLSSVQLRYRGDNGAIFNIGHRYRREGELDTAYSNIIGLEQVDISASLPINDTWSVIGRYYRSLDDQRTLETLAGVQYNSCCWATRFVFRDYINDINSDDRNTAFFIEIQLKGLGSFGNSTDSLLQESIIGYE